MTPVRLREEGGRAAKARATRSACRRSSRASGCSTSTRSSSPRATAPRSSPRSSLGRPAPHQARDRGLTRWDGATSDARPGGPRGRWLRPSSCSPRLARGDGRDASSLERRRRPRSRPRRRSRPPGAVRRHRPRVRRRHRSTRSASIPTPSASRPDFSPWEVVGRPERRIDAADEQAHVRTTYVAALPDRAVRAGADSPRCTSSPPGRVSFARRRGRLDESSIDVRLPAARVYSRLAAVDSRDDARRVGTVAGGPPLAARTVVPLAPGRSCASALRSARSLLAAGGVALAYAAWPRGEPRAACAAEPEPPTGPVLSPLEQALVLLEDARAGRRRGRPTPCARARRRGAGARGRGDPELARRGARAGVVGGRRRRSTETSGLAARVRACSRRAARDATEKWRAADAPGCCRSRSRRRPASTARRAARSSARRCARSHPAIVSRRRRRRARRPRRASARDLDVTRARLAAAPARRASS